MNKKDRYFLAANGFSGFRCYFDELINDTELKRLYIVKGGSGVGKSTLMHKLGEYFGNAGDTVEEILCSSDPDSLDGVLIKRGENTVALIDGTSPHQYDMRYPIARDCLVDLSVGICEEKIEKQLKIIAELIRKKTECYKFAYSYLQLSGNSYKILMDECFKQIKSSAINELLFKLPINTQLKGKRKKTKLYSAVSRLGFTSLDISENGYYRVYSFKRCAASQAVLTALYERLFSLGDITLFKSPLDDALLDGFSLDSQGVLFKLTEGDYTENEREFFSPDIEKALARLECADKIYRASLDEAVKWLDVAFLEHRRLEEIYGEAMDFTKNAEITEKLILKINNELNS